MAKLRDRHIELDLADVDWIIEFPTFHKPEIIRQTLGNQLGDSQFMAEARVGWKEIIETMFEMLDAKGE